MFGMIELVEHCIKRKCKIDMVTTEGPKHHRRFGDFPSEMTPLGYACAEGHVDIVDMLLDHEAPFEEDKPHSAVLWTAAYQGHAKVVDLLLRRFNEDESHGPKETARFLSQRPHPKGPILFAAVSSGGADVVETLLVHGAKYESNWFNATPLIASATIGSPKVAKTLLEWHSRGKIDADLNKQANHGRTAFWEACRLGNVVVAELLLEAGADYRIPEKDNTTSLQVSCYFGRLRLRLVTAIINKTSRELQRIDFLNFLNTRHRPTGNVALIDCAEKDRLACLSLLLEHGADYTMSGNGNYTILHAASRHDDASIMSIIVGKAAQDFERPRLLKFLNARHENGNTALIDCVQRSRLKALNILLATGADCIISGQSGNTALHWACIEGHDGVVTAILRHVKSNEPDPSLFSNYINGTNDVDNTSLMEAAAKNNLPIVKTLLAYKADYTLSHISKGLPGITALHSECWSGSEAVIRHLLETASQELEEEQFTQFINARNGLGKTALHDAAETGPSLIVKLLLEKYNAYYSTSNQDDITPLHAAAINGHVAVVEALLHAGSSDKNQERFASFIGRKSKWHKTTLMDAAERGRTEVIRLLLNHGAGYTLVDGNNFTALHYCAFRNKLDSVRILLEITSKEPQPERFHTFINQQGRNNRASALHDTTRVGPSLKEVAKLILKHKPAYYTLDSGKRTPLHHTVATGNTEVSKLLLEYAGRDPDRERFRRFVNAVEEFNKNVWRSAVRRNQGEVVEALRKTGVLEE